MSPIHCHDQGRRLTSRAFNDLLSVHATGPVVQPLSSRRRLEGPAHTQGAGGELRRHEEERRWGMEFRGSPPQPPSFLRSVGVGIICLAGLGSAAVAGAKGETIGLWPASVQQNGAHIFHDGVTAHCTEKRQ